MANNNNKNGKGTEEPKTRSQMEKILKEVFNAIMLELGKKTPCGDEKTRMRLHFITKNGFKRLI